MHLGDRAVVQIQTAVVIRRHTGVLPPTGPHDQHQAESGHCQLLSHAYAEAMGPEPALQTRSLAGFTNQDKDLPLTELEDTAILLRLHATQVPSDLPQIIQRRHAPPGEEDMITLSILIGLGYRDVQPAVTVRPAGNVIPPRIHRLGDPQHPIEHHAEDCRDQGGAQLRPTGPLTHQRLPHARHHHLVIPFPYRVHLRRLLPAFLLQPGEVPIDQAGHHRVLLETQRILQLPEHRGQPGRNSPEGGHPAIIALMLEVGPHVLVPHLVQSQFLFRHQPALKTGETLGVAPERAGREIAAQIAS